MAWANGSQVLNLVPATGAGSDDDRAIGLVADVAHQRFGDLQGEFVFLFQSAEGAGHAATTGIKEDGFTLRQPPRQALRHRRIGEGFDVTMGMDQDPGWFGIELKGGRIVVEQLFNEVLKEKAVAGYTF